MARHDVADTGMSDDDDPDAIETRIDSIVQSILAGPCDVRAKEITADPHQRAIQRRSLQPIEAREQVFLTVSAGIRGFTTPTDREVLISR